MNQSVNAVTQEGGGITSPGTGSTQELSHEQLALEIVNDLTATVARIPKLLDAQPDKVRALRARLTIPVKAIVTGASAVEQSAELQASSRFNVADARESVQYTNAFNPVADCLKRLFDNVKFSCDSVQAEATAAVLHLYALAKGMAHDPASQVTPHVLNMKRDLKRKVHKAPKTPVTPTAPSSPTAPAPQPVTGEEVPKKVA
jgi:hypothetical protein